MDLDNAKLLVISKLESLLYATNSQNSKYVVSINSKQKSLKCEKIYYLIILYCLDFYNELSEDFKIKIQEVIWELGEVVEKPINDYSGELIEIPEEYRCFEQTILEYFLTNIDDVLDDCKSECFCSNNVINCFITFMTAITLIQNNREKEGQLLLKFIDAQLKNIYRDGVEYSGLFYLDEDYNLYGFVECQDGKCHVEVQNQDTLFELMCPANFNLKVENGELYGN